MNTGEFTRSPTFSSATNSTTSNNPAFWVGFLLLIFAVLLLAFIAGLTLKIKIKKRFDAN